MTEEGSELIYIRRLLSFVVSFAFICLLVFVVTLSDDDLSTLLTLYSNSFIHRWIPFRQRVPKLVHSSNYAFCWRYCYILYYFIHTYVLIKSNARLIECSLLYCFLPLLLKRP